MVRSRKITHLVACIVTLLAMGVAVAQHATAQAPPPNANADDPITSFFTGISLIAWAFGLIPTIIAFSRGHASKGLLAVLNVIVCLIGIIPIFGWIVAPLGWIGIFIWAASGEAKKEEAAPRLDRHLHLGGLGRGQERRGAPRFRFNPREEFEYDVRMVKGWLRWIGLTKPVRDVGPLEPDNSPLPPETGEDKNKLEPADRGVEIEKLKRQDLTAKPNLND